MACNQGPCWEVHAVVAHVAHVAHVVAQEMGTQCYHIIAIWRNPDEIDLEGLYPVWPPGHYWSNEDLAFVETGHFAS